MSYTRERDQFLLKAQEHGIRYDDALKILRYASTLQRLAVAQCNGDYPADNGERKTRVCDRCETSWAPESLVKSPKAPNATTQPMICKDCRTQDLVRAILPATLQPVFGGDPRGAVLRLYPAEATHEDIDTGRARGELYVPARER